MSQHSRGRRVVALLVAFLVALSASCVHAEDFVFEALYASGAAPSASGAVFVASESLGRGLVLGGVNASSDAALNLSSPIAPTWTTLNGSALPLTGHCAALDSQGRVLVFGGLPSLNNPGGLLWSPLVLYPLNVTNGSVTDAPIGLEDQRFGAACASAERFVVRGGAADDSPSGKCSSATMLAQISDDGSGSVTWTVLDDAASAPPPKRGAVLVTLDAHTVALVGGVLCEPEEAGTAATSPVWRLNLENNTWTADKFDTDGPLNFLAGLRDAAVQVLGDTLFVYGGVVASNPQSSLYSYSLTNQTWLLIANASVGVRIDARLAAASPTRALLFGGASSPSPSSSLVELVNEAFCTHKVDCFDCLASEGCLYAESSHVQSTCVAGTRGHPYVLPVDNTTIVVTEALMCPQPRPAPRWLIPVVVVVLVVILFVVAGSYWLDTRKSMQRAGYASLPA